MTSITRVSWWAPGTPGMESRTKLVGHTQEWASELKMPEETFVKRWNIKDYAYIVIPLELQLWEL